MDVKIEVTKTLRKCLKCDTEFYSKGIANRRCDVCVRKENNSSSKPKDRYKISINLHQVQGEGYGLEDPQKVIFF